jgi:hypothetical protein
VKAHIVSGSALAQYVTDVSVKLSHSAQCLLRGRDSSGQPRGPGQSVSSDNFVSTAQYFRDSSKAIHDQFWAASLSEGIVDTAPRWPTLREERITPTPLHPKTLVPTSKTRRRAGAQRVRPRSSTYLRAPRKGRDSVRLTDITDLWPLEQTLHSGSSD